MSQAEQLHEDIERSRHTAREIVAQHEKTKPLESKVTDAAAKVDLLQVEIAFNDAVTGTLEAMQRVCRRLEFGRAALARCDVIDAIETVEEVAAVSESGLFANTNLIDILVKDMTGLREEIVEFLSTQWNEQISIDKQKGDLRIRSIEGKGLL